MNFIPEYTHYRKNQGSILIKICGKQEGVFRQFDVLQLPESGDFKALHRQPSRNFDRCTKLDLTTEPPLLGSCC
jgi:hypothetical protein